MIRWNSRLEIYLKESLHVGFWEICACSLYQFLIKRYETLEIIEVMCYIPFSNGNKMAFLSTKRLKVFVVEADWSVLKYESQRAISQEYTPKKLFGDLRRNYYKSLHQIMANRKMKSQESFTDTFLHCSLEVLPCELPLYWGRGSEFKRSSEINIIWCCTHQSDWQHLWEFRVLWKLQCSMR